MARAPTLAGLGIATFKEEKRGGEKGRRVNYVRELHLSVKMDSRACYTMLLLTLEIK